MKMKKKKKSLSVKDCQLPIHQLIKQIKLDELLWDFAAVSLYLSAIRDKNSIYPTTEIGFAFTEDLNDQLVKNFNTVKFNQRSAILKIKYYNSWDLVVQHLPTKEREKQIAINLLRNGYIIDTLASVDIGEIVKIGGKVIEIYEGVINREIFKISPFRKIFDKLFAWRQKHKKENNEVMQ